MGHLRDPPQPREFGDQGLEICNRCCFQVNPLLGQRLLRHGDTPRREKYSGLNHGVMNPVCNC